MGTKEATGVTLHKRLECSDADTYYISATVDPDDPQCQTINMNKYTNFTEVNLSPFILFTDCFMKISLESSEQIQIYIFWNFKVWIFLRIEEKFSWNSRK